MALFNLNWRLANWILVAPGKTFFFNAHWSASEFTLHVEVLQQNESLAPDCLGTEFIVRVHAVHNKAPSLTDILEEG